MIKSTGVLKLKMYKNSVPYTIQGEFPMEMMEDCDMVLFSYGICEGCSVYQY